MREKWLLWGAAIVVVFASLFVLGSIPPLDFDEALYRRMAEEMLKPGASWLVPTWDGQPMFDKPPTFVWAICFFHWIFDSGASVSTWAARFASGLFSLVGVGIVAWHWPRLLSGFSAARGASIPPLLHTRALPFLLFGLFLLPSAGASLVLLDPMLSAALAYPLCRFSLSWLEGSPEEGPAPLGLRVTLGVGASLGIAVAIKGLVGIVLPGLALVLHMATAAWVCSSPRTDGLGEWLMTGGRRFFSYALRSTRLYGGSFALALALGVGFYSFIWFSGGEDFVREFFMTHHFRRGSAAMEGHGGPFFYHFVVVILGGFPLSFWILARFLRGGLGWSRHWGSVGMPLSWSLAFLVFFGLMATKLPNYSWPVWPALIILSGFLLCTPEGPSTSIRVRISRGVMAIAFALAVLICAAIWAIMPLLGVLALRVDGRAAIVLKALGQPSAFAFVMAYLASAMLVLSLISLVRSTANGLRVSRFVWGPVALAIFSTGLTFGLGRHAVSTFVRPVEHLTRVASTGRWEAFPLTTWGLRSPTVSSHYSGHYPLVQRSGRHEFLQEVPSLILAPAWKFDGCRELGLAVVVQDSWVGLCARQP